MRDLTGNPVLRYLLLAAGWLCLITGIIAIFIPLLPTTPLLLLAAVCFLHSSRRLYDWLVNHPWMGPYIASYLAGEGIPWKAKLLALVLMWPSLLITAFVIFNNIWIQIILPLIGAVVTGYLLYLPTAQPRDNRY